LSNLQIENGLEKHRKIYLLRALHLKPTNTASQHNAYIVTHLPYTRWPKHS